MHQVSAEMVTLYLQPPSVKVVYVQVLMWSAEAEDDFLQGKNRYVVGGGGAHVHAF
jgi:hypothetical protein